MTTAAIPARPADDPEPIPPRTVLTAATENVQNLLDVAGTQAWELAQVALATMTDWLSEDATEIRFAQILLSRRPGDTDLTAARAQISDVLDVVWELAFQEIGHQ